MLPETPARPVRERARAPLASLMLILATIAVGLAVRTLPSGLPPVVIKHAGSVLWALMIYEIVAAGRPGWTPRRSAMAAVCVTTAVESSQLYHRPMLDQIRDTVPGALVLGRVFSVWDLFVYAAAIAAGMMVHRAWRRRGGGDPT